jgi:hypothetical protein
MPNLRPSPLMDVREGAAGQLEEARRAVDARSWTRGYELLTALRAQQPLGPEDLERLAKAAYWTGDADGSIWAREEAYAAYLDRGDDDRAALCALTLRREHLAKLRDSVADAWLSRAERLLTERPDSTADGYLAIAHADDARARGHFAQAFSLIDRAEGIAVGSDDRELHTWAAMRRGMFLIDEGRVGAGWPLIEQVAASAAGGELGVYTTGAVLANVVTVCRDLGDYRRGIEWADAAMRWCERQHLVGFPGICRLHRAEILRMLGALREALDESTAAVEELGGFSPVHAGAAQHELGEIRLRLGDLDGADEALRHAHDEGEDPQPGLALLRLAQGRLDAASSSIRLSLEPAASDRFRRAQLLQAYASGRAGSSRRSQAITPKRPGTSAGRATDGARSARRSRRRRRRPRWPRRSSLPATARRPPPSSRPRTRRSNGSGRSSTPRGPPRAEPTPSPTVARPAPSCSPTSSDRPR